jgi:lipopolysaccharide export system protein LptA
MIRVKLISAGRLAALAAFVAIATALVAYLVIKSRRVEGDQLRPKLQGRVVAVFYNTRYAHEVEGRARFVLTSGVDKTYEDGTHELEQVKLESFGVTGQRRDVVTSNTAKISDPSALATLDAEFVDNVVLQTSDGMTVKTAYLHYDQAKNNVDTEHYVEFEGSNFAGHTTGLLVEATDERVHLVKDVNLVINPKKEGQAAVGARGAQNEKARNETPEQKAARKARKRARKLERRRARAASNANSRNPKPEEEKPARDEPTTITSSSALLERKEQRATFNGNVVVTQSADEMRADRMVSYFNSENQVERLEARGNSYLKQSEKGEVRSTDIDFFFDKQELARAFATGGVQTLSLGTGPKREARAATMEITFKGGLADVARAQGEAVVNIHAPQPAAEGVNPTERELKAAAVTMHFFPDGANLKTAEAAGDAVLTITPVKAMKGADKKTLRAPQMTATFFESDSRMKTFNAGGGVRVDIEATVPDSHPPRVVTGASADADFTAESQDVERLNVDGDVKYNEGDRNATAERAAYDGGREVLNLRGKRPMVWDSKARTQADEIDYDHRADVSHARGDVRTTYYSRETTGGSTPFKNSKSPIFMTAERADSRNSEGVAVYTGNARGWQDDDFVKADRIELYQNEKRMVAAGHVESAFYKAKREDEPGQSETVPGFASADNMVYSDVERRVRYEGGVKARQGTDRVEAEVVDVFLQQETNEVDRLLAEGGVVLTQPGKRGTGDNLTYTAADGRTVLAGKTARVDDREKGTTMGTQLTFNNRDDKISVENQQGTGRVRSTHRLTKNK